MSNLLNSALSCVKRGWYVFPCWPKSKNPMTKHGFKDATLDESKVYEWWGKTPDANVAIATGPSKLLVVDVDHGASSDKELPFEFEQTYMVRTGRRPEYGVQIYFQADGSRSCTGWKLDSCSGDIRAEGGYVLAVGSIHPDSGEAYTCLVDAPPAPPSQAVKNLAPERVLFDPASAVDDATADGWKTWLLEYMARNGLEARDYEKRVPNGWWLGAHCPWESQHGSGPGSESSTVVGLLDGRIAFECSHGTCKAAKRNTDVFRQLMALLHNEAQREPGEGPEVILGTGTGLPMPHAEEAEPVNWRSHYHTFEQMESTPPPVFLIEDFLLYESITALAAPVGQRKSLVALNVAHALCTGAALFDRFTVKKQPSRVLYLCPEMGIRSFADRVRRIGLMPYVGETLFCRTMSMEGELGLAQLTPDELDGAVIIVDTAVRFLEGDENSSEHMRAFAAQVFRLSKEGHAAAVLLLHHSAKGAKESTELTLENAMRGSGELGAFVTCCWATRLQDPEHPYQSASFLANVKPRDFDAKPFEVTGGLDCRLHFVGDGSAPAVLVRGQGGNKANKDGKDEAARAIIKANLSKTVREIKEALVEAGIKRSDGWISTRRVDIKGTGSRLTSD